MTLKKSDLVIAKLNLIMCSNNKVLNIICISIGFYQMQVSYLASQT